MVINLGSMECDCRVDLSYLIFCYRVLVFDLAIFCIVILIFVILYGIRGVVGAGSGWGGVECFCFYLDYLWCCLIGRFVGIILYLVN